MFNNGKANCVGRTKLFFNERNRRAKAEAKTICRQCEVREECRDYAIDNHIFYGVWGGLDSREIEAERRIRGTVLPPHYGYARARRTNCEKN